MTSDGPTTDGPTIDGPAIDGPAIDGPASDGPASDGPPRVDGYGDLLSSTCAQLQANYLTILEQAKACNPVAAMAQCMVRVDDELACPCDTYAQATNEGPLSRLNTIKGDWRQAGCAAQVACLPTPCPSARSNNCQAVSGNQGRCEN